MELKEIQSITHPLSGFEVYAESVKCFPPQGSGFFHFAPISVIIGKNNSGKSTVIDIIRGLASTGKELIPPRQRSRLGEPKLKIRSRPDAKKLKSRFPATTSGGGIPGPGSHWDFAQHFLHQELVWTLDVNKKVDIDETESSTDQTGVQAEAVRKKLAETYIDPLQGCSVISISAERDVRPEKRSSELEVSDGGIGTTNLVRAFINSEDLPRSLVEETLLRDLNHVYMGDSEFLAITCQESHEELWEIFLKQEAKGDIRLSESGNSLKSVFIILAFIRLIPQLRQKLHWGYTVFCVEEPENNLHPALLRRLLELLAGLQKELGFSLVITSRSPICIDWAAGRDDSTILHVKSDKFGLTRCKNVFDHNSRTEILNDLDVRGSDILQSNGIIWVEGPSDRIYLNRWIALYGNGLFQEGIHYSVLYYGGKVLSNHSAKPKDRLAEESKEDLVSMISINRNVAVVMDSDRKEDPNSASTPKRRLNETKRRIIEEITDLGGFVWVTAGKEIENYTPTEVWSRVAGTDVGKIGAFEAVPEVPKIKKLKSTKVELAHRATERLSRTDVDDHLDLSHMVNSLLKHIRKWNGLTEHEMSSP